MNKISFMKLDGDEQVFKGEIYLDKITGITPHYQSGRPFAQSVKVEVNESKLQVLFYDIWAAVGDDVLQDWLKGEGKQIINLVKEHDLLP